MGFDAKELEVAMHAGLGNPALLGDASHTPLCRAVLGLLRQSSANPAGYALINDRTVAPRTKLGVNPAIRCFTKRAHYLPTMGLVTSKRRATALLDSPTARRAQCVRARAQLRVLLGVFLSHEIPQSEAIDVPRINGHDLRNVIDLTCLC